MLAKTHIVLFHWIFQAYFRQSQLSEKDSQTLPSVCTKPNFDSRRCSTISTWWVLTLPSLQKIALVSLPELFMIPYRTLSSALTLQLNEESPYLIILKPILLLNSNNGSRRNESQLRSTFILYSHCSLLHHPQIEYRDHSYSLRMESMVHLLQKMFWTDGYGSTKRRKSEGFK